MSFLLSNNVQSGVLSSGHEPLIVSDWFSFPLSLTPARCFSQVPHIFCLCILLLFFKTFVLLMLFVVLHRSAEVYV